MKHCDGRCWFGVLTTVECYLFWCCMGIVVANGQIVLVRNEVVWNGVNYVQATGFIKSKPRFEYMDFGVGRLIFSCRAVSTSV